MSTLVPSTPNTFDLIRTISISNLRSVSPMFDEFELVNKDSLRAINVGRGDNSRLSTSSTSSCSPISQPLASGASERRTTHMSSSSPAAISSSTPYSNANAPLSVSVTNRVQHALNLRLQMITPVLSDMNKINGSKERSTSTYPTIVGTLSMSGANAFLIAGEGDSVSKSDALQLPASERLANLLASLHSESLQRSTIEDEDNPRLSSTSSGSGGSNIIQEREELIDRVLSLSTSSLSASSMKKRNPPPRRPVSPAPRLPSPPQPLPPPSLSAAFESAIQAEYPYPLNIETFSTSNKQVSTTNRLVSPSVVASKGSSDKDTEGFRSTIDLISGNAIGSLIQSIGSTHSVVLDRAAALSFNSSTCSPAVKIRRAPPPPPNSHLHSQAGDCFENISSKIDSVYSYLTGNESPMTSNPLTQDEITVIEKAAIIAAEDEDRKKEIDELSTKNATERSSTKENLKRLHKLNALAVSQIRVPFM